MPRKKAEPILEVPTEEVEVKPAHRLVQLKTFVQRFQKTLTPLLVIALLVAVYYIGNLRGQLKTGGSITSKQLSPQGLPYATADIPPVTSTDHIRGNPNAKAVFVEYSDYECPYCKSFHPTMQQLVQTYGNDIAWVYRQFPIQQIHQNAPKESEAAECVAEIAGEEAFWRFTDGIVAKTTSGGTGFALDQLPVLAKEVGVTDEAKFKDCLDSGKMSQKIQASISSGTAAGIEGTPTTFVLTKAKPQFFFFKSKQPAQIIPGVMTLDRLKDVVNKLG